MKRISTFNDWLAQKITAAVGTMACAYLFAALALTSLPSAIQAGRAALVAWTAQTFLQLVLLSILAVGQRLSDAKHAATQASLEALHGKQDSLHEHLGVEPPTAD